MIKSLNKALVSFLGSVVAFLFVIIIRKVTGMDQEYQLLAIILLSVVVFAYSLRYVLTSDDKRFNWSGNRSAIKREFVRSSYNSTLMFYAVFDVYYRILSFFSLNVPSFYEKLAPVLQDQVRLSNPLENAIETIGIAFFSYIVINTMMNFISSNSEELRNKYELKKKLEKKAAVEANSEEKVEINTSQN